MNLEQFPAQKQEKEAEKEKRVAESLQLKLEKINGFKPSGDISADFNNILELTGRDSLYKKVSSNEDPQIILAGLISIKTAWQEILKNPNNVDTVDEAKRLFYIDVPNAEIETVNKLINFYLDKFSIKQ